MNDARPTTSPESLADLVCSDVLRCRVGLVLLPPALLGSELVLATRLNLDFVSYRAWRTARLRADQKYLGLSDRALLDDVEIIVGEPRASLGLLLANLDLPLAAISRPERLFVWSFLSESFAKRPRGLVIALPRAAERILPAGPELDDWRHCGRLAEF